MNIDENKVYYVGFSDGSEVNKIHYVCMYSEREETTKEWCVEVKKKYPNSNITYLKMTGRLLNEYRKLYSEEYEKFNRKV